MSRKVFVGQKTTNRINTGGTTVGTSVSSLSDNDRELDAGVQVIADPTNTGIIYVGVRDTLTADAAATAGFPLTEGQSLFLPVRRESDIKLVSDTTSQTLHFMSF